MLFFELLQIAIGNRDRFSQTPTEGEWRELFALAQKQAMVGIAFRGVEQLPGEHRPPKQLLMQWYMATERIKKMNADLDRKALAVAEKFRGEGFPGVVLKGQGIAKLYTLRECAAELQGVGHWPLAVGSRDDDNAAAELQAKRQALTAKCPCCHPEENIAQHNDERLTISEANSQQPTANLSIYRTPGDIDIWLHGERKEVLDYVRRHVPDCKPVYHHVDFPVVEGLDIEVHFTPSWMNSPVTNRRLQRFFRSFNSQQNISHTDCTDYTDSLSCQRDSHANLDAITQNTHCCARVGHPEEDSNPCTLNTKPERSHAEYAEYAEGKSLRPCCHPDGNSKQHDDECLTFNEQRSQELRANSQEPIANNQAPIANGQPLPVPSLAFNRVYILVHIYRHLFAEGIGLRQLLDYYFVLCQGFTEEEREETMRVLRSLKMERFARAVMWVLQAVYGMEERYLLVAPDEREGRFLLDEIMLAGNFGQYDERLQHEQGESALHWGWRKVVRNFRFVRSYPSEVLWSPIFKLWHLFWRKRLTAND